MRKKIFTALTGTLTAAMLLGMTSFAAVDDSQLSGTTIEFWHSKTENGCILERCIF